MNIMRSFMLLLLICLSLLSHADTLYPKQWALNNQGQESIKDIGKLRRRSQAGTPGIDLGTLHLNTIKKPKHVNEVVVAVIDSGLDIKHPDLKGRLWFNKKQCSDKTSEQKKTLPCRGWNFLNNNNDLTDDIGHGTHVAGIIAAAHNQQGIRGFAFANVKVMPVKVMSKKVQGFIYQNKVVTDIFADAIRFAIENGAHIINLSLGWPKILETPKIKIAIETALKRNIAVVAAAGNNYKSIPTFPCSYEGVICVGAHDNQDKLSSFSNHGGRVDLLAPGESIVSTYPMNLESRSLRVKGYAIKNGSSQAAPYVSAMIANLKTLYPAFTLDQLKALLFSLTHKNNDQSLLGSLRITNKNVRHFHQSQSKGRAYSLPSFKSVLDIKVNTDQTFSFKLPIKNYGIQDHSIEVIASVDHDDIKLTQQHFTLSIPAGITQTLNLQGQIHNLSADSHAILKVTINDGSTVQRFTTQIVFNRVLDEKFIGVKHTIEMVNPQDTFYFTKKRKGSFLTPILDEQNIYTYPEFFFYPDRQKSTPHIITVLKNSQKGFKALSFQSKNNSHIVAIYRKDFNLDGIYDYMVYSQDKDYIYFHFVNQNFKPLYGHLSVWQLSLKEAQENIAALIEHPNKEIFHWIKRSHPKFGNILVPHIYKQGLIPQEDNTTDLLDKIHGKQHYHYFLEPKVTQNVSLKWRVIDNYNLRSTLKEEFELYDDESLTFSAPLTQTDKTLAQGQLIIGISIGEEFDKRYFHLKFNDTKNYHIVEVKGSERHLDRNNIFPLFRTDAKMSISDHSHYFTLFNQQHARMTTVKHFGHEHMSKEFKSASWQDPIINYIAGFVTRKNQVTYITTRYSMNILENGVLKAKLPIYRESSLSSTSFTETFKAVVLDKEKDITGIYTDSTIVYGDRVYFMKWEQGLLTRPIDLSYIIPRNCIALGPKLWGSEQRMVLQCFDQESRKMQIRHYPIR